MPTNVFEGRTVAFVGCPAYSADEHNTKTTLNGLFVVVEYLPYEPSNYVHSPMFIVEPQHPERDEEFYSVDADVFTEQVLPKVYGQQLVSEREMEFAAEHF